MRGLRINPHYVAKPFSLSPSESDTELETTSSSSPGDEAPLHLAHLVDATNIQDNREKASESSVQQDEPSEPESVSNSSSSSTQLKKYIPESVQQGYTRASHECTELYFSVTRNRESKKIFLVGACAGLTITDGILALFLKCRSSNNS